MSDGQPSPDDAQQKAEAWLSEKWVGSRKCPICETDVWMVTGLVGIPQLDRVRGASTATTFPSYQAVCRNCGFVHLFNALVAGIDLGPQATINSDVTRNITGSV